MSESTPRSACNERLGFSDSIGRRVHKLTALRRSLSNSAMLGKSLCAVTSMNFAPAIRARSASRRCLAAMYQSGGPSGQRDPNGPASRVSIGSPSPPSELRLSENKVESRLKSHAVAVTAAFRLIRAETAATEAAEVLAAEAAETAAAEAAEIWLAEITEALRTAAAVVAAAEAVAAAVTAEAPVAAPKAMWARSAAVMAFSAAVTVTDASARFAHASASTIAF